MIEIDKVRHLFQLPDDTVILRRRRSLLVLSSPDAGLVFRVGFDEKSDDFADPVSVSYSHRLAWDMHNEGLNVLPPVAADPIAVGRYVVSTYPHADSLARQGWRVNDPFNLGAAMALWSNYRPEKLRVLDIPAYTSYRIRKALQADDPDLRSAAAWCQQRLNSLMNVHPWSSFDSVQGCIHGDPNLGNLVRRRADELPLFIDLDTVKRGPTFYDLAVMTVYNVRYSSAFPAEEIIDGYRSVYRSLPDECIDRLRGWKEFSSFTQLLTRWQEERIRAEFWRRTELGPTELWQNVVGTEVSPTCRQPEAES